MDKRLQAVVRRALTANAKRIHETKTEWVKGWIGHSRKAVRRDYLAFDAIALEHVVAAIVIHIENNMPKPKAAPTRQMKSGKVDPIPLCDEAQSVLQNLRYSAREINEVSLPENMRNASVEVQLQYAFAVLGRTL